MTSYADVPSHSSCFLRPSTGPNRTNRSVTTQKVDTSDVVVFPRHEVEDAAVQTRRQAGVEPGRILDVADVPAELHVWSEQAQSMSVGLIVTFSQDDAAFGVDAHRIERTAAHVFRVAENDGLSQITQHNTTLSITWYH